MPALPAPPAEPPPRLHPAVSAVLTAGVSFGLLWAVGFVLRVLQPAATPVTAVSGPPFESEAARALDQARQVAERALAVSSWREAEPWLLGGGRLAPERQQYHSAHPWTPQRLAGPHRGSLSRLGGVRAVELTVGTDRGTQLTLWLRETSDGWKLDWKRLVKFRHFAWMAFQEKLPEAPVGLDLIALRGSATDAHFAAAGLTSATGLAVRLDGPNPGAPVLAVVSKASDLGRLLQRELTWEQPRTYRCRLRGLDATLVPPLVEITAFEADQWSDP